MSPDDPRYNQRNVLLTPYIIQRERERLGVPEAAQLPAAALEFPALRLSIDDFSAKYIKPLVPKS